MRISVVIPVFDTAAYLPRCLDSVRGQTFEDIEIICVDDCSSDGSPRVLEAAASADPRLKVIRFPATRGVSAARNAGLDAASGEYVYFMDSDDWIDRDYLEAMVSAAREEALDIVLNPNYQEGSQGLSIPCGTNGLDLSKAGWQPSVPVHNYFITTVWTRLYRREFLRDNALRFPEGLDASEDFYFTKVAGMLNPGSYIFPGPFYHHTIREGSLSRANTFSNIIASRLLYEELMARGVPLDGLKLFYAGRLVIDTEDKFDLISSFFHSITDLVRGNSSLYTAFDLFCFDAVSSCEDWEDFRSRYCPALSIPFIRDNRHLFHDAVQ